MLKCPRKLKLVDFAWYFVVLTRGFYLTALTTCRGLGRGENAYTNATLQVESGKTGASWQVACPPKGTKTLQYPRKQKQGKEQKVWGKKYNTYNNSSEKEKQKLLHTLADYGTARQCQTARQTDTQVKVVRARETVADSWLE